jgi:dsRNA-specific ribonuclease
MGPKTSKKEKLPCVSARLKENRPPISIAAASDSTKKNTKGTYIPNILLNKKAKEHYSSISADTSQEEEVYQPPALQLNNLLQKTLRKPGRPYEISYIEREDGFLAIITVPSMHNVNFKTEKAYKLQKDAANAAILGLLEKLQTHDLTGSLDLPSKKEISNAQPLNTPKIKFAPFNFAGFDLNSLTATSSIECFANIINFKGNDDVFDSHHLVIFTVQPLPQLVPCSLKAFDSTTTLMNMIGSPIKVQLNGGALNMQAMWSINFFDTILNQKVHYTKILYIFGFLEKHATLDQKAIESLLPYQTWNQAISSLSVYSVSPHEIVGKFIIKHTGVPTPCYVEAITCDKSLLSPEIISNTQRVWKKNGFNKVFKHGMNLSDFILQVRPMVYNSMSSEGNSIHSEYAIPQNCTLCPLTMIHITMGILLPRFLTYVEAHITAIDFGRRLHLDVLPMDLFEAMTLPCVDKEHNYGTLAVLGDVFIELAVTTFLFLEYPKGEKGDITSLRSTFVSNQSLRGFAEEYELARFLNSSPYSTALYSPPHSNLAHLREKGLMSAKALASCVEAIIGACCHSRGLDSALRAFKQFGANLDTIYEWSDFGKYLEHHSYFLDDHLEVEQIDCYCAENGCKIRWLQHVFSYEFHNPAYLIRALTHTSSTHRPFGHQQRLSVLGDSVVKYLLVQYYLKRFRDINPHTLSVLKQHVLNYSVMGYLAVQCQLDCLLIHNALELSALLPAFINRPESMDADGNFSLAVKPPKVLRCWILLLLSCPVFLIAFVVIRWMPYLGLYISTLDLT